MVVVVAVVDEDRMGDLERILKCACVRACVYDYISILNYQYFLIVFTTSLHQQ